MASSTKSPLKILLEGRQLVEVLEDDVLLFKPNNGKTFGIGAERVNHSAAIVVIGQAILMAHISNCSTTTTAHPTAAATGDPNTLIPINPILLRLQGLLYQYADKFAAATTQVWVLLSHPDAEHSPDIIRDQILASMAAFGFDVNVASYTSVKDNEGLQSPRGVGRFLEPCEQTEQCEQRKLCNDRRAGRWFDPGRVKWPFQDLSVYGMRN